MLPCNFAERTKNASWTRLGVVLGAFWGLLGARGAFLGRAGRQVARQLAKMEN